MLRYSGDYRDEQVRLLRELYVLYQTRAGRGGYYGYAYGDDRSIELSAIGSRQLWDRTHRIGQTRNVMVYRLVAKDTIEEKVMALKARKARLFSSVLDDGNVFGTALDADDIRALFS